MEEKLRSISRRIHWSLFLRAAIFAALWLVLPFWLFFLLALYLYFSPPAQARGVVVPYFILLLLTLFESQGILAALIFGAVFYYVLLIKGLLVIDRRSAYELLVLFLSFVLLRDFYMRFGGNVLGGGLFAAMFVAAIIGFLAADFLKVHAREGEKREPMRRAMGWFTFILCWQFLIAGLFLPLDFTYQAAIVFLPLFAILNLVPQYFFGVVSQERTLATASMVFVVLAVVLSSARWGI